MACEKWPGSSGCHSISWQQHVRNVHDAQVQRIAQQGANNGNPGLQANLAAQPGQAVVGATPAPAPPVWSPDSGYNNEVDVSQRAHDRVIGALNDQERTTKYDYGYDDPTNPFSRVNELKRNFLANGLRVGNGLAAIGQGLSGARQRAISRNQRNESAANAQLRAAYEAALSSLKAQRGSADTALEEARLQALTNSMSRQGF